MVSYILQEPLWLQAWVGWMALVNSASVLFLGRAEARWVLAAWLGNLVFMTLLYELNGYNRLLGLSHVLWWTPLVALLVRRRRLHFESSAYGAWLTLLVATIATSLVIDYVDVARYLLGDRA